MIARLSGRLADKQPPVLVIDVGGVGYEVEAPLSVFYDLPAAGETVTLLTHMVVREDAQILFGFLRDGDRRLFRELLKVSGVGPRLALAILSGVSADEFGMMVQAGDSAALTRLPGIGRKTAERLILEMRGRLEGMEPAGGAPAGAAGGTDPAGEARAALTALGYAPAEALKLVRGVAADDMSAEAIIRAALKAKLKR